MKQNDTTIVLVGGFGQNQYLRSQIQAALGNVTVLQSPQSWTAVVRGALMMGLASNSPDYPRVRITARKARKNYGLNVITKFEESKHDRSRKFWSPYWGYHQIRVMQ